MVLSGLSYTTQPSAVEPISPINSTSSGTLHIPVETCIDGIVVLGPKVSWLSHRNPHVRHGQPIDQQKFSCPEPDVRRVLSRGKKFGSSQAETAVTVAPRAIDIEMVSEVMKLPAASTLTLSTLGLACDRAGTSMR